ncbi:asparagine synthase (glutamine-hydrolyzing) [Fulvivirgaceae bacterium BMA10]|uniref:asparagine synthase (glutamine-hydrolyzing) n=1 Tax=Splendidivirga corallicola TaxID=3051826 RepID=A0ABT8KXZ5_9BACT|nr:asparagine synthase (glutamine-hydrolyzing) [Fulvivirgaceae bacterium BMA10]
MCGIAGVINFQETHFKDELLHEMASFLNERGPDNKQFWKDKHVGLAHTRLSIIDLSSEANQPFSIDNSSVISFNGEIYNFRELRNELIKHGHKFRTDSDTEVLLHGYSKWGINGLLERIDGMFAFALYDIQKGKVFLVRDFFGKKPLYYYSTTSGVKFSSDIRSIWSLEKNTLTLNYESIDYYLLELTVPQPQTIWEDIFQVEPGAYLTIDLVKETVKPTKYWSLEVTQDKLSLSRSELLEQTENMIVKAILKRTVSDVPIGCFLSGGIDSGLVVSLLAQNTTQKIKTFSIGLSDEYLNELPEARIVAGRYDTDHYEIILEPQVLEILPELVSYYGEPFADSSMVPTYYVTKALNQNVKVALSGDGGDELFGGYNDYNIAFKTERFYQTHTSSLARNLKVAWSKVHSRFTQSENLGSCVEYASWEGSRRLNRQISFQYDSIDQVYGKNFMVTAKGYAKRRLNEIWSNASNQSIVDTLLLASLQTRLLNDYLVKVDRASMKNSLEVRSPFLDKDLAKFAFSLPHQMKFQHGTNKYILKHLATKHVDENILKRPKRGFGIPIHQWFKGDRLSLVSDMIFSSPLKNQDILNFSYIENILKEHRESKWDHSSRIWSVLCLALWFEKFKAV